MIFIFPKSNHNLPFSIPIFLIQIFPQLTWNLYHLVSLPPLLSNQTVWSEALQGLARVNTTRSNKYNARQQPIHFNVNDWVMCNEHKLSKTAMSINARLLPIWLKPFIISVFILQVKVELVDPVSVKYIRTSHISQLKRFFLPHQFYLHYYLE